MSGMLPAHSGNWGVGPGLSFASAHYCYIGNFILPAATLGT